MSRRSWFSLALLLAAGLLLSTSDTVAQSCPNGTLVVASADHQTGPGQITGGNVVHTRTSNNKREVFTETLQNGVSRLYHAWRFDDVPAGNISVVREGYRLSTPDGDNFKFGAYYDTPEGPFFILGAFCTISSETEGTQQCSFNAETFETTTWYVTLQDTNHTSGTDLTSVSVDYVALCSQP